MSCIAVTRGGTGDVWRFRTPAEAGDHPLIQFNDIILTEADQLAGTFSAPELAEMAGRIGLPRLQEAIRAWSPRAISAADVTEYANQLWSGLMKRAVAPPSDPAEIVRLIRQDRAHARSVGITYRPSPQERSLRQKEARTMTDEVKKGIRAAKFSGDSVIHLGKDQNDKPYGEDNNPKRAGSAAHTRFSYYKDGMTIDQAIEAGVTRADINWDVKQGFITVS